MEYLNDTLILELETIKGEEITDYGCECDSCGSTDHSIDDCPQEIEFIKREMASEYDHWGHND